MSIIIPIIEQHDRNLENCSECVEYIFENSENLPDGFYINIMDLLKKYYDYGNNLDDIHNFLEENKKALHETVYNKIKTYLSNETIVNNREDNNKDYFITRLFVSAGLISLVLVVGFGSNVYRNV